MAHFIEGLDRQKMMLLPEYLDDYVDENVRAIDAFVDSLDLAALGFNTLPAATGRPGYHPGSMAFVHCPTVYAQHAQEGAITVSSSDAMASLAAAAAIIPSRDHAPHAVSLRRLTSPVKATRMSMSVRRATN